MKFSLEKMVANGAFECKELNGASYQKRSPILHRNFQSHLKLLNEVTVSSKTFASGSDHWSFIWANAESSIPVKNVFRS